MSASQDYERQLVEHANRRLGPASARLLATDEAMDAALRLLSAGGELGGAVLKVVYERLGTDAEVDNEFATWLLDVVQRKGHFQLAQDSALRRVMSSCDLANSVLANMWPKLSMFTFDSEDQFVALLARRLDYHVKGHLRRMTTQGRSEHKRVDADPELFERPDDDPDSDPELAAIRAEQRRRLQLIVLRLTPRQREVFSLVHKGVSTREIAERLGLTTEAVRLARERAIEAAASLLGRDRER